MHIDIRGVHLAISEPEKKSGRYLIGIFQIFFQPDIDLGIFLGLSKMAKSQNPETIWDFLIKGI